ncbi:hypothetical protein RFI_37467 [Reticulomyxa filosa]|uniref:Uncharacterized protein n=1 Tax=Reticulomyxa filosa TaxID=46433 RepID=X6LFT9_RETFI|nr:hypothetical protein RFI_37467 [Reticulomyxa filosa]|eukprot:ETN99991.1 hypothetical protein RFI_37467 [Reticulomyxa filosa]
MQLEIEETNQMLNTMTNEVWFDYGDNDNENEIPSTTENANGKQLSGKKQKQRTNGASGQINTMTEKDMDYLLIDIGEKELHKILQHNHITIEQLLDDTVCIDTQKIKQYQRKLKRHDNDTQSNETDKNQTETQNKANTNIESKIFLINFNIIQSFVFFFVNLFNLFFFFYTVCCKEN